MSLNFMNQLFSSRPAPKLFEKQEIDKEKVEEYLKKVEKTEESLDDWAVEQAKKTEIEYWPGSPSEEIIAEKTRCAGCGAPINQGPKCNYCGGFYIKKQFSAEEIADAIWNTPTRDYYKKYWENLYKTRRACK